MGDFRTKCSVCGKTIRVQTGTKKRRCVNCDFIDLATKMKREPRRASENKESARTESKNESTKERG